MAQLNETPTRIQAPPRTTDVNVLRDYVAKLADILALLSKDLDFIINGNLDVKNIRANSISADRLNVDELSAITANLGHVVAGLIEGLRIIGSFIATSEEGVYPRAEMSSTDKLFRVMLSPTNFAEFISEYSLSSQKVTAQRFVKDADQLIIGYGAASSGQMGIGSNGPLVIGGLSGVYAIKLDVTNWDLLLNNNTGKSLQQELNSLTNSISSLASAVATKGIATGSAGSHNHGIPDGTQLMTSGGGTVTYFSAGGHSHTQN